MVGDVGTSEDHHVAKVWSDFRLCVGHFSVPEFELTSRFLILVIIQVHDHVQLASQSEKWVHVEVGVHFEAAPGSSLMLAPAGQVGITDETRCASQVRE